MKSDVQATPDVHKRDFTEQEIVNSQAKHPWAPTMAPVPDPTQVTVTMAEYLKLADEKDTWMRRALDAEACAGHSGDILGEGPFRTPKGKNVLSGFGIG